MPARRARVVLVSPRGRVALIRRRRAGRTYWSFPGGRVRDGEGLRDAARREVAEELGLDVRPGRRLVTAAGHALYLARSPAEPRLRMLGPEARKKGHGTYEPQWVPLDAVDRLDVRPRAARQALARLRTGVRHAA